MDLARCTHQLCSDVQLFKKYPNMEMQLLVKANEPPSLSVTPQAATFTASGNVTVFVVCENKTLINVFTLNVVLVYCSWQLLENGVVKRIFCNVLHTDDVCCC